MVPQNWRFNMFENTGIIAKTYRFTTTEYHSMAGLLFHQKNKELALEAPYGYAWSSCTFRQKFQRQLQQRAPVHHIYWPSHNENAQKKGIAFPDKSLFSLWCYINQEYQHQRELLMNISSLSDPFLFNCPSYGIYLLPDHSILYNASLPFYFARNFPAQSQTSENLTKDCLEEFHSKSENNIVLATEDFDQNKKTFNLDTESKSSDFNEKTRYVAKSRKKQDKNNKKGKVSLDTSPKDFRQKENRNIFSNILRIFMKNTLQLQRYADLIDRIITKNHLSFSVEDFYNWLWSFNINFKNYIRFKQILKILKLEGERVKNYQKVLVLLLQNYLSDFCMQHSLTSRKINGKGRRMHIEGIRLLQQSLFKACRGC